MITIANATIYTIKGTGDMAYEIEYSEGTKVRAVKSKVGGWIRKEAMVKGAWELCGKPYIVKADKKRQAEQIVEQVLAFIA
jgi:hypothetical protein